MVGALKIKGVPFLLTGFSAYCAAGSHRDVLGEHLFVEVKGITTEQAARLASLFYIGITAGRFLSGFITDKLGDRKMIILGACVLSCGVLSLLLPIESPILAFAGFVIIGLGCAPIYPCIIHSTPNNFGAENSGAIIGIQMASAYVGSTFIPPLFGLLGNFIGFKILPIYLFAFIILMIVMTEATFKITTKKVNLEKTNDNIRYRRTVTPYNIFLSAVKKLYYSALNDNSVSAPNTSLLSFALPKSFP